MISPAPLLSMPLLSILVVSANLSLAQTAYIPPSASAGTVKGIPFASAKPGPIDLAYTKRFHDCDTTGICDGKAPKFGCQKDQNRNTAFLTLPGGVLFYDAKLGVDADGSPLAMKNAGPTDQPVTSFTFKAANSPSVNSDAVPYIVVPLGNFKKDLGVSIGDIAAVVFKDQLVFALVADNGPPCKIGEGSIQLHKALHHDVCKTRDAQGECTKLLNSGIEKDVLFFIFKNSAKNIRNGLTPQNINDRLSTEGQKLWDTLKSGQAQ